MVTSAKNPGFDSDLKAFIATSIKEVLDDPDFGLELTEATKRRLRSAKNKKQKWVSHAELKKRLYWRRRASEMQKSTFAFPSPALPTEGGRESEIGGNALRFCAGSVFRPAGSTPCGVGMSQFTSA